MRASRGPAPSRPRHGWGTLRATTGAPSLAQDEGARTRQSEPGRANCVAARHGRALGHATAGLCAVPSREEKGRGGGEGEERSEAYRGRERRDGRFRGAAGKKTARGKEEREATRRGRKELNRGQPQGLTGGPHSRRRRLQTASRTCRTSAPRPRAGSGAHRAGLPRSRPKTRRGRREAGRGEGNGGWAADAWPAHDEKKRGERAGRGWAAPWKPTQERGEVFLFIFLFLALIHH